VRLLRVCTFSGTGQIVGNTDPDPNLDLSEPGLVIDYTELCPLSDGAKPDFFSNF